MHTLYVLRHAKSSWSDPALPDEDRPLAPRGRRAAKSVAKHLVREGIAPELVLCSPARRTRETLELLRPALATATVVAVEDELYGASAGALVTRLRAIPEAVASVLLIGHNPALQDLILALALPGSERDRLAEKFPTAALATLTFGAATWEQLADRGGLLAAYVVPRELT